MSKSSTPGDQCILCGKRYAHLKTHLRHKKCACISQNSVIRMFEASHRLVAALTELGTLVDDNPNIREPLNDIREIIGLSIPNPQYQQLRDYGKEDFSILTPKILKTMEKRERSQGMGTAFQQFVRYVYCNPTYLMNHCIKITNRDGLFCHVFSSTHGWEISDFEDVCIHLATMYCKNTRSFEMDCLEFHALFAGVQKDNPKDIKKFRKLCQRRILPLFYNLAKQSPNYEYLIPTSRSKITTSKLKPKSNPLPLKEVAEEKADMLEDILYGI